MSWRRQQRRENAEREAADEPVAQRLLVLIAGQPQHHDGHDERVVGAQQAFEHNQGADDEEVARLKIERHAA